MVTLSMRAIGLQFLLAALAAVAAAVLLPDAVGEPAFLAGIGAAAAAIGATLRFTRTPSAYAVNQATTAAVVLVAGAVLLSRPLGLAPLLFLWPLLLSAHHAPTRRHAANAALAAVTFALSLAVTGQSTTPVTTFLLFGAATAGATIALRRISSELALATGALERAASRDPLTGALRAEAFQDRFDAWVGNGTRRHAESSLLLIDVDDIDAINQAHGHEAGDAALRHLADLVHGCIRETDAFGRLDGEEFALLFPATAGEDAMTAAERIRAAVEHHSAEHGLPFTISIGVTGAHAFSDPWAAARRALSLAKAAGSNYVVLAETETQAERLSLPALVELERASQLVRAAA